MATVILSHKSNFTQTLMRKINKHYKHGLYLLWQTILLKNICLFENQLYAIISAPPPPVNEIWFHSVHYFYLLFRDIYFRNVQCIFVYIIRETYHMFCIWYFTAFFTVYIWYSSFTVLMIQSFIFRNTRKTWLALIWQNCQHLSTHGVKGVARFQLCVIYYHLLSFQVCLEIKKEKNI